MMNRVKSSYIMNNTDLSVKTSSFTYKYGNDIEALANSKDISFKVERLKFAKVQNIKEQKFKIFFDGDIERSGEFIKETHIDGQSITAKDLSTLLDRCFTFGVQQRHLHPEMQSRMDGDLPERLADITFTEDEKTELVPSSGRVEVKSNFSFDIKVVCHRSLAYLLGLGDLSMYSTSSKNELFDWIIPGQYEEVHYYDILRPIRHFTLYGRFLFAQDEEVCNRKFKSKELTTFDKEDEFLTEFQISEIKTNKMKIPTNNVERAEFYFLSVLNDRILFDYAEITCFFYFKK